LASAFLPDDTTKPGLRGRVFCVLGIMRCKCRCRSCRFISANSRATSFSSMRRDAGPSASKCGMPLTRRRPALKNPSASSTKTRSKFPRRPRHRALRLAQWSPDPNSTKDSVRARRSPQSLDQKLRLPMTSGIAANALERKTAIAISLPNNRGMFLIASPLARFKSP
jgi:hypothetical protein